MQIDQARQQRRAAEVDDARPGGIGSAGADRLDPFAANDHDRRRDRRAAAAVDEPRGPHRNQRRRRRLRAEDGGEGGDREDCFMTDSAGGVSSGT